MERPPSWDRRPALLIASVMFMEQLDGTILVTAAPQIARDFGISSAEVGITMTVYLITVATLIPVGGWLTSRFGPRRIFCLSILIFTLASIVCAFSGDLTVLVLGRILQGVGGALMVPVGRLIVLRSTDKRDLLRAIAYITWPALLAPVLAPLAGGLITTYASWHWIFLINVPLGAAAMVVALRIVTDRTVERRALDWRGLVWCSIAVFSLIVGIELAADPDQMVVVVPSLVVALVAAVFGVRWLLRARNPLIDLRIYQVESFRVANSGGFIYRLVISSVPFLLPLFFQDGFGWTPVESGLLVTAVFLGNIAIKPATTPLLGWLGFRTVLIIAVSGGGGLLCVFALLTPETPIALIFAILLVSGALRSIGFTAYNTLQFAEVNAAELPSANTLSATTGQLANGLGIAVGALSLQLFAAAGGMIPYQAAFILMAVLTVLPLMSVIQLSKGQFFPR